MAAVYEHRDFQLFRQIQDRIDERVVRTVGVEKRMQLDRTNLAMQNV